MSDANAGSDGAVSSRNSDGQTPSAAHAEAYDVSLGSTPVTDAAEASAVASGGLEITPVQSLFGSDNEDNSFRNYSRWAAAAVTGVQSTTIDAVLTSNSPQRTPRQFRVAQSDYGNQSGLFQLVQNNGNRDEIRVVRPDGSVQRVDLRDVPPNSTAVVTSAGKVVAVPNNVYAQGDQAVDRYVQSRTAIGNTQSSNQYVTLQRGADGGITVTTPQTAQRLSPEQQQNPYSVQRPAPEQQQQQQMQRQSDKHYGWNPLPEIAQQIAASQTKTESATQRDRQRSTVPPPNMPPPVADTAKAIVGSGGFGGSASGTRDRNTPIAQRPVMPGDQGQSVMKPADRTQIQTALERAAQVYKNQNQPSEIRNGAIQNPNTALQNRYQPGDKKTFGTDALQQNPKAIGAVPPADESSRLAKTTGASTPFEKAQKALGLNQEAAPRPAESRPPQTQPSRETGAGAIHTPAVTSKALESAVAKPVDSVVPATARPIKPIEQLAANQNRPENKVAAIQPQKVAESKLEAPASQPMPKAPESRLFNSLATTKSVAIESQVSARQLETMRPTRTQDSMVAQIPVKVSRTFDGDNARTLVVNNNRVIELNERNGRDASRGQRTGSLSFNGHLDVGTLRVTANTSAMRSLTNCADKFATMTKAAGAAADMAAVRKLSEAARPTHSFNDVSRTLGTRSSAALSVDRTFVTRTGGDQIAAARLIANGGRHVDDNGGRIRTTLDQTPANHNKSQRIADDSARAVRTPAEQQAAAKSMRNPIDRVVVGTARGDSNNPIVAGNSAVRSEKAISAHGDATTNLTERCSDKSGRINLDTLSGRIGIDVTLIKQDALNAVRSESFTHKGKLNCAEQRYLTGIELLLAGLATISAVARHRGEQKAASRLVDSSQDAVNCLPGLTLDSYGDDTDESLIEVSMKYKLGNEERPAILSRPKYLVQPGDTLVSIAEDVLHDAQLAWLILQINRGSIASNWNGNLCMAELNARQEIELPVAQDIVEFYRSRPSVQYKNKRLITTVKEAAFDRELLVSNFRNVIQTASSVVTPRQETAVV